MYHPTSRVLAVLELLQSYRRMTGAELAERLEVNIRTLRRYITTLQDIGIPIHAERGRYGAYTLGVGFRLPPMMFTNDEALALEIGLLAASLLSFIHQGVALESARAKLENVLPDALRQQIQSLHHSISMDLKRQSISTSSNLLFMLSEAIQDHRQIQLLYRASDHNETERTLDPYGIAYHQGCWYLVGHCHLRDDMRSFRLDRILKISQSETYFHHTSEFDVLAYIKQSIATLERQYTYEVLLETDIVTAKNAVFEAFGELAEMPDGVLLRGTANDLDWVARQLAALPFDFVIHTPEALKQALCKRATELLAIASKTK